MLGKPTIKGTRITVEIILNLLEHGQTIKNIMEDYDLTQDQVKSAINFANRKLEVNHPAQKAFAYEIFIERKRR